jgi:hypothetical protein
LSVHMKSYDEYVDDCLPSLVVELVLCFW